jgi:hypothetical protein
MGIKTEYNPDLALRNFEEFRRGNRKREECIPEKLEAGKLYEFLKKGQRNYWLEGEIPLVETNGKEILSRPLASILILEATHFMQGNEIWTRGKYRVVEVFDPKDRKVHFEGFGRREA